MTHKFNIGDEVYLRSEVEGLKSEIRRCTVVGVTLVSHQGVIQADNPIYSYTWGDSNWNTEECWKEGLLTPGEAATLLEECKEKVQLG